MRITFILPGSGRRPSGGFRIVYEHANRLAARGHDIRIIHTVSFEPFAQIARTGRLLARHLSNLLYANRDRGRWIKLDGRVRVKHCLSPTSEDVGDTDAVVATSWQTAFFVASLPPAAGEKFYFLQSYEDWDGPSDLVQQTWKLPLRKIVIAQWLKDRATALGETVEFVSNAIDMDFFRILRSVEERPDTSILFQSLERSLKGSAEVVKAIEKLRASGISLTVRSFGHVDPKDFGLSAPYTFVRNPSQEQLRDLYNASAVYVSASHIEGWGLTLAEAAACGAALVVSDIGGHRELAQPGRNALLFAPKDVDEIADCIAQAVSNRDLRLAYAQQALQDVSVFTWETASLQMERALTAKRAS